MADKQHVWSVKIEDEAATIFGGLSLTRDDKEVIQVWAKFVRKNGPEALQTQPGMWADHALYGDRRGERASSFSNRGRIIYRVEEETKTVIVVKITHEHSYKKEK